ncbi:MAG: 3-dehydroquinate synthase [Clostridia bacterium]|nr:3-dehydroquinate synthase [Clostridia bacterium]
MITVAVDASRPYDILIEDGLLVRAGECLAARFGTPRLFLVSDDTVFSLYGETTVSSLKNAGFDVETFVVEHGEKSKNAQNLFLIVNRLAEKYFTRGDMLVALGGGVVGDLCGFCAATFLRGVRYIQIPTTLLACVDSSVGGKTAVDLPAGKNLFGAFWQPSLVLCDPTVLDTLPPEQFASGMAEVIKYGMIADPDLFETVKTPGWKRTDVIARCVEIKRDIVNADERDTGIRQILNFGHTFGHAVESLSDFSLSHGACVAIGMMLVTRAFQKTEQTELTDKLASSLTAYGLPTETAFSADEIFKKLLSDKKRSGDALNLIVVRKIGKAEIRTLSLDEAREILRAGLVK